MKAHASSTGNNNVDALANRACGPPPLRPQGRQSPWDILDGGPRQHPPHKTWTEPMIPTHRHRNIHRISFTSLRRMSCIWVQWIFGLMWREGFAPYTTFWNLQSKPCPLCKGAHNQSIHGYIAVCPPHPLHKAWLHAWRRDPTVHDWYTRASALDWQIVGRLCILESLYAQHGRSSARRRVFAFQQGGPGPPDATTVVTGLP